MQEVCKNLAVNLLEYHLADATDMCHHPPSRGPWQGVQRPWGSSEIVFIVPTNHLLQGGDEGQGERCEKKNRDLSIPPHSNRQGQGNAHF